MSPLFRKSEKKIAEEAALEAKIKRLRALSVEDLAVALLPGLIPDDPHPRTSLRVQQLCNYLVRDCPGAGQQKPLMLMSDVNQALTRLERVELVSSLFLQRSPVWRITRLGESAVAEGTVEEHLRKAG
jgi:hypothetical protein